MILSVTLNPAMDHFVLAENFTLNKLNRVKDLERHAGGKGVIMAMMLGTLGCDVIATGFTGRTASHFIHDNLHERSVSTSFIPINDMTRHNYIIVDDISHDRTLLDEEGPSVDHDELRLFKKNYKRLLNRVDIVILAGSLPRNLDYSIYCELLDMAREAGVKSIINTEEENMIHCCDRNPFLIMPDTRSSNQILGQRIDENLDKKVAACRILGKSSGIAVFTTDHVNYIVSTQEGCYEAIAPPVEIRSKYKAGDGFIAGFVYSLTKSDDIKMAIRWGIALSTASSTYRCRIIESKDRAEQYLEQVKIREV